MDSVTTDLSLFFSGLQFEPKQHIYTVQDRQLKNVSNIVSGLAKPFNLEENSLAYSIKHNIPQEEVKLQWKKAGTDSLLKGTNYHKFAENPEGHDTPLSIKKFFRECINGKYSIIFRELKMYHKKYFYSGTCDLIIQDSDGKYTIIDFKTGKPENLHKNFRGQCLYPPFNKLLDTNFNKYQIQLSLYKLLLQQIIPVSELWIVRLEEDNYIRYITEDFSPQLEAMFENFEL